MIGRWRASFTLWTNLIHDAGPKDSGTTRARVGARQAACRRSEKSEYYGTVGRGRAAGSVLGLLRRRALGAALGVALGRWLLQRLAERLGERLHAPTRSHHDETRQLMVAHQGPSPATADGVPAASLAVEGSFSRRRRSVRQHRHGVTQLLVTAGAHGTAAEAEAEAASFGQGKGAGCWETRCGQKLDSLEQSLVGPRPPSPSPSSKR